MRKLIAVLVLSIVVMGMGYAPPEPIEPPVVSIGEQPMEAVAVVQNALVKHSYALTITMEQPAVTNTSPVLVDLGIFDATADCNLQSGTNPPLLTIESDAPISGMILPMLEYNATANEHGAPEVAGLSSRRLVLLLK